MTLGEKLKKLRSERRISLNEVSRYTRIPLKYLEYLDEGNYAKLPADVYVKGFLKNYADFLGVDEKIFIKSYEKERGISKSIEKIKRGSDDDKKNRLESISISSYVITPKIIITFVVVILIIVGIGYLYREFGSFSGAPRLIVLSPEKNYITNDDSVVIEGVTEVDAKVYINEQPIIVNDEGKFRENVAIQSGNNTINIKAINRFNKQTEETLMVQSNFSQKEISNLGEEFINREINDEKKLKLEIRVDPGPVWLSVETDGNLVFSGTMLAGAIQSFEASEKINVNSGKGNATFIKFNGKEIGPLSQDPITVRGVVFDRNTKY